MKLAYKEDLQRILSFLKKNLDHCVYIYIDITKYGLENPNIKLWYSEYDTEINSVAMKYYDSFQLCSVDEKKDEEKIKQLLTENPVKSISGSANIIRALKPYFEGKYECNFGIVVRETKYKMLPGAECVEEATVEDCLEIATLLCEDPEFGDTYDVDVLAKQLRDRINTKMGRNFILRKDGKIVAHCATFAEIDELVVQSGLIVLPEYRNRLYGIIIYEYVKKFYIEAGKTIYAFRINEDMKRYIKSPGTVACGEYGKFTRIGD